MLRNHCNQEELEAHDILDAAKYGLDVSAEKVNRALFVLGDAVGQVMKESMQPYQQRVIQEKAELDTKIQALTAFAKSDAFSQTAPEAEQRRMLRQLVVMQDYSRILGERIDAFGGAHG